MSEHLHILESLIADVSAGRPAALCTIVATRGSTPQCPGATMLVRSDMSTTGTLGGGCVEATVRKQAYEMLLAGKSGLASYVLDHDFGWDDGLICGGRMDVGIMPVARPDQLSAYQMALDDARKRRPARFPVVVDHEGSPQTWHVLLEVPPTLLIAGAGHVGHALARLAVDLDFHVVVIDDRVEFAARERFGRSVELVVGDIAQALRDRAADEGCYVVIVTRGHSHDEQALDAVINSPAGYIGLIGSRRKARIIFDDLKARGVAQQQLDRVHTPIGADIGAITVPEIAVSIAAQLVQVRRQQSPALVEGPSHAAPASNQ